MTARMASQESSFFQKRITRKKNVTVNIMCLNFANVFFFINLEVRSKDMNTAAISLNVICSFQLKI